MSVSDRIDGWQQRHRVLGFPVATIYKFGDDTGPYLAAIMTYYAFVSVVPLLLLASTILGVVLVGNPDLQERLLNSAFAQFPVVGEQLRQPEALSGGTASVVIGILGALYGGIGAAQALQYAGNTIWHVPRNKRPNPFLARGRSLVLIATAGLGMLLAVIGSTILHLLLGESLLLRAIAFLGAATITMLVLLVAFELAPNKRLSLGELLPGAITAALALQLLQSFGYLFVDRVIRNATDTNGVFAIFLGMIVYLYVASVVTVFAMEINVVHAERLWPRALLTPFTDDVVLTEADQQTYRGQAQAQRAKGFQEIDVRFDKEDQSPKGS